jgi:hypothetical protein
MLSEPDHSACWGQWAGVSSALWSGSARPAMAHTLSKGEGHVGRATPSTHQRPVRCQHGALIAVMPNRFAWRSRVPGAAAYVARGEERWSRAHTVSAVVRWNFTPGGD